MAVKLLTLMTVDFAHPVCKTCVFASVLSLLWLSAAQRQDLGAMLSNTNTLHKVQLLFMIVKNALCRPRSAGYGRLPMGGSVMITKDNTKATVSTNVQLSSGI